MVIVLPKNSKEKTYSKEKEEDYKGNSRKMCLIINDIINSKNVNAVSFDELNIKNVPMSYADNPNQFIENINNIFFNISLKLVKQATQRNDEY